MTVKALASLAGVSPHTVRYYADIGLLAPVRQRGSGYREFSEADVNVLRFVPKAKALGFTLAEIRAIVQKSRRPESPCPMVRDVVRRRLSEFGARLNDLALTHERMGRAAARWKRMPDRVPTGREICHLIESVATEAPSSPRRPVSGGRR
jgi:MerR family transcriptional regulator, Zn(II)-responsive regulator of zntA